LRGPKSLTGRVTLAATAAVAGALIVAGIAVVIATGQSDRADVDRQLRGFSEQVVRRAGPVYGAMPGPPGGPNGGPLGERGGPGGRGGERGAADGPGGDRNGRGPLEPGSDSFARVLLAGGGAVSGGANVPAGFPVTPVGKIETVSAGGQDWRTLVRPLGPDSRVQVAIGLGPLQERASRLLILVLAAIAGALVATALVTRYLARLALAPVQRLRLAADEVAATADLSVRVPDGNGPEEIDDLAEDLNAMLSRLELSADEREQALESARRFAADAGHELRTPLTSLKANLATGATVAATADADRLAALVDQLQQLARGESGPPRSIEPVDLGEAADACVVAAGKRHPDVTWTLEAPDSGPLVAAEAESLRMMLENLLENAALHGRPDGNVTVTAAATGPDKGPAGPEATLTVDDDGDGIPEADRERMLERFTRGEAARHPGTGLGLAIAAAQATRCGGSLQLSESPSGGLRLTVRLPASIPTDS
jgi:two-component system sensor histidine kinase PrrB